MRNKLLLLLLLVSGFCYGQKKYPKVQVDTIRTTCKDIHPIQTKKDSVHGLVLIENSYYSNGSLSFLMDCTWTIDMNINGQEISKTSGDISLLEHIAKASHKRGVYIYNIKKKMSDGTIKHIPSKQIIIE